MQKSFYTNVMVRGDSILYRGMENGRRVKRKVPFTPTLYVPTEKKTEWKSLDGRYMEEFRVGSIYETNKFIKEHRNTAGLEIHGNTDYAYSYIAQEFSGEVEYDIMILSLHILILKLKQKRASQIIKTQMKE